MGAFLRCYVCGLITPTADMFAGECPSCRGASEEDDPILERYANPHDDDPEEVEPDPKRQVKSGVFTFESMGGLVKGRCGKPSVGSAYAIGQAATRLKHELAAMSRIVPVPQVFRCNQCPAAPRDSGPCNSSNCEYRPGAHKPDAGPLFAAVDGGVIKSER